MRLPPGRRRRELRGGEREVQVRVRRAVDDAPPDDWTLYEVRRLRGGAGISVAVRVGGHDAPALDVHARPRHSGPRSGGGGGSQGAGRVREDGRREEVVVVVVLMVLAGAYDLLRYQGRNQDGSNDPLVGIKG